MVIIVILSNCKKDITFNLNKDDIALNPYYWGNTLEIKPQVSGAKIIKLTITNNGKIVATTNTFKLDSTLFPKLGEQIIEYTAFFDNNKSEKTTLNFKIYSPSKEKSIDYQIINEYPHDVQNFTEGLYYENGIMTESTGMEGKSRIVQYKLGHTTALKSVQNAADIFGEGVVHLGDKIYQMTYNERKLYEYDTSLNLKKEIALPEQLKEGWGATTDGKLIYATDGTDIIKVFDKDFNYLSSIQATGNTRTYDHLNELEYIDGYLWANIFLENFILKIDPKSGKVLGGLDFSAQANIQQTNQEAVLNGIAYNPQTKHLFLTGKMWPTLYEIKLK